MNQEDTFSPAQSLRDGASHTPRGPGLMKAARYHRIGEPFSIDLIDKPQPRAVDVLVEVKACGVVPNFHTVLEHIADHPTMSAPPLPAIYGLDTSGVIAERGAQVYGFSVGDRVYVNPVRFCGACRACRRGKQLSCDYVTLNGYFGTGAHSSKMFEDYRYGGFAEFMTAPQYSLVKLPDTLSFETAARWGYLGTAYSGLRKAGVNMSSTVLINGVSGTLGLGAVMWALALGAPKVLGVGRDRELLASVKALAPDRIEVLSVTDGADVAAWARSHTDGHGADVVLDALPTGSAPDTFLAGFSALGRGGVHVNIGGVYAPTAISPILVMNANQSLIGSFWFTTAEGQEMADLVGSGMANLDAFEHRVFPLERIDEALTAIDSRRGGFSNFVVQPGGGPG